MRATKSPHGLTGVLVLLVSFLSATMEPPNAQMTANTKCASKISRSCCRGHNRDRAECAGAVASRRPAHSQQAADQNGTARRRSNAASCNGWANAHLLGHEPLEHEAQRLDHVDLAQRHDAATRTQTGMRECQRRKHAIDDSGERRKSSQNTHWQTRSARGPDRRQRSRRRQSKYD
jgi:hypothetical protein